MIFPGRRNLNRYLAPPPVGVPLNSVSDPDSWVIRIRIQGLKKRSKILNHHKIFLLFRTSPYRYTFQLNSFDEKIKNEKSYNYEIILYYFQIVLKISLDPGSGVFTIRIDLWPDPDPGSMNMDPKNVPLHIPLMFL